MKDKWLSIEIIEWPAIICSLFLVAGIYIFYLINMQIHFFQSDMATEMLTGQEMYLQGSLFLSNWYFSTEVFTLRAQPIMALALGFTDNLFLAYGLAVGAELLLLTGAAVYCFKSFGLSPKAVALALLFFYGAECLVQGINIGIVYAPYAFIFTIIFTVIGYYANLLNGRTRLTEKFLRLALIPAAFLLGLSSLRMTAILFFPLMAVHFYGLISQKSGQFNKKGLTTDLILWLIASALGFGLLLFYIQPQGFGPSSGSSISNLDISSWPDKFYQIARRLVGSNGLRFILHFAGSPIAGLNTWLAALTAGLSIILYSLILFFFFGIFKSSSPDRRSALLLLLLSLGITIVAIFLTLGPGEVPGRYLAHYFILASLITAFIYEKLEGFKRLLFSILVIIAVITNCWANYVVPAINHQFTCEMAVKHTPEIEARFKQNGVTMGYATYWQAYLPTILTEGRIKVTAVTINLSPYKWVTAARNYSPALKNEKTALILLDSEIAQIKKSGNLKALDILAQATHQETITDPDDNFNLYFFNQNFFTDAHEK